MSLVSTHIKVGFSHAKCDFDMKGVIFTHKVCFLHKECFFHTQSVFSTHTSTTLTNMGYDFDTHEYHYDRHEFDLYTQSANCVLKTQ
jgi:hypothetical protein